MAQFRVGVGYDIHRLIEGRRLVLGGVELLHDKGLAGHSDGDVVLHALADALLGACNLPDIGDLFPDTDPKLKGVDSRKLVAEVIARVRKTGFEPNNADCIIHAERPRLTEHKRKIADSIATLLGIDAGRISVKAKTAEGMGPVGTFDAIAATVVASVVQRD